MTRQPRLLEQLLGPDAPQIVAPGLSADTTVRTLEPIQVTLNTEGALAVCYDAEVERAGKASRGWLVVAAGTKLEGTARIRVGRREFAVWPALDDPFLPGLRRASQSEWTAAVFQEPRPAPEAIETRLQQYWPGRTAALTVTPRVPLPAKLTMVDGKIIEAEQVSSLRVKVVPPGLAAGLANLHGRLAQVAPVLEPLAVSNAGVAVFRGVKGRTLQEQLRQNPNATPAPARLVRLCAQYAKADVGGAEVPSGDDILRRNVELLERAVPDEGPRLERFVRTLGPATPQPRGTVHGDLHAEQILVDNGEITAVLDPEYGGTGEPVDDIARLAASVITLANVTRLKYALDFAAQLMVASQQLADPAELRRRVAVALLAEAAQPFRYQSRDWQRLVRDRITLAERWLETKDASAAVTAAG